MPGIGGNNINNGPVGGGKPSVPTGGVAGSTQPAGNSHVGATITNANRNKSNESYARANANRGGLGSRSTGSSIDSGSKKKSSNTNQDGLGPVASMKKKAYEKAMEAGLATQVGPQAAKQLVKSKPVQRRLNDKAKNESLFKTLNGLGKPPKTKDVLNDLKHMKEDISDAGLKSKKDKQAEAKEKQRDASGEFTAEISRKVLKVLLLVAPLTSLLIIFIVIITVVYTDQKVSSMVIGELSSEKSKTELKDGIKKVTSELGTGDKDLTGKAATGIPVEYQKRMKLLGNLFTTEIDCNGDECFDRPEFMYYLKIADISYRYKQKYGVTLDWSLITATNLYFDESQDATMKANLGGYSDSQLDNTNATISLDWDYDYKNINGYQYLDADDSMYDLQILAKNMVKKVSTMSCIDGNGNVTQTSKVEDVEDRYITEGGSKALSCGAGETYSVNSTYTKDLDKFDEFLLEYIDKKMFTRGTGKNKNGQSSSGCVSTNSNYVWPIGSKETTNSKGVEYALGEPETVYISSRFGSKEGFRISGHGGLDIAGVPGPGVVNVVATKSGKVIYPKDKSQTGFADKGYYGNRDGGGYGNYVIIEHDDGNYSLYGHLAQNSIQVYEGDIVDQGQVIAKVGHSGSSTGPHLHFEIRSGGNSGINREDPLNFVDPSNPRPNVSMSNSCTTSENKNLVDTFVSVALEEKNDASANGGFKYREFALPSYGKHYHWCAAFVSWVIYNTESNGKKLSEIINFKSTWVYEFMNYFYNEGKDNPTSIKKFYYNDNCSKLKDKNNLTSTYKPKKGDLIFFDWNNKFTTMPTDSDHVSHIGIVTSLDGDVIHTIEGNTGGGNGKISEKTYDLTSCNVIGFGSWY